MDFVRLAVVEMRRNSTRITVAIVASALAAMIIVLLRFIPQGYALGAAIPQRVYTNGDILVYPGLTGLYSENTPEGQRTTLTWQIWPGADWQSHVLDFFPVIPQKGYLVPPGNKGWKPMNLREIADKVRNIDNIEGISAYRGIPCMVRLEGVNVDAILVGRDLPNGPDDKTVYTLDPYVDTGPGKKGRSLTREDQGHLVALIPGKIQVLQDIKEDTALEVILPRVTALDQGIGLSWDQPQSVLLTCAGKYAIQVGEMIDENSGRGGSGPSQPSTIPIYWDRPEVVVPMETFAKILYIISQESSEGTHLKVQTNAASSQSGETPISESSPQWVQLSSQMEKVMAFLNNFPTYQIAIKVNRMSYLRETTKKVREALGSNYGVYAVPELTTVDADQRNQVVMSPDLHGIFTALITGLASVVVSGNIYILVAQQRRKIGLLRVVGATSKNIMVYVLSIVAYVSLLGTSIGFLAGKLLYILALIGSDLTIKEWLLQAVVDFVSIAGLSLLISLAIGSIIAYWASKIPCAEVLTRE